jgi:glycosyltransferase involved in cell wall biosynthesis
MEPPDDRVRSDPPKPRRVVHVETGRHLYGGAAQVLYLMGGLRDEGVESILVAPPGSAVAEAAEKRNLRVRRVPLAGEADLRFVPRLAAVLREEAPDLVHCHSRRGADTLGGLAARTVGVPAVVSRRVDNPEAPALARLKYGLYRKVITISERIREQVISTGVPERKVTCVRSAVELERWSGPCDPHRFRWVSGALEGEVTVGVAAQLIERKGHRDLLEALPAILARVPHLRTVFFGRGPLEEELRTTAARLGLASRITFAGFVDDLEPLLPCLDLLVHPAHMEGLGVILLQASAAGVPIVAARAGGIPEVVREGVNGLMVPPGDPPSLANAVLRVLEAPDLSARLREGGRSLAREEFSVGAMVRGNLAVYREVLGGPG